MSISTCGAPGTPPAPIIIRTGHLTALHRAQLRDLLAAIHEAAELADALRAIAEARPIPPPGEREGRP